MTIERVVGVCCCIVITSGAARGQQRIETANQSAQPPTWSFAEYAYPGGAELPWRQFQTRSESDGREVVTQIGESLDVDGQWAAVREIRTETTPHGAGAVQTRRDLLGFPSRQRTLLQTTTSTQQTLSNTDTKTVQDTYVPDLNGRLGLARRSILETRLVAPDVLQTVSSLLLPGSDGALEESVRTERSAQRIGPTSSLVTSFVAVRDVNGRWQPVESRSAEVRDAGPEHLQEETIRRRGMDGTLQVAEKAVTRRTQANGREEVVIERYFQDTEGYVRSDSRGLGERVRVSRTLAVDGGHVAVEEVEARNPVAAHDPMRVIRRTLTTVRRTGPNQWVTERRVFELGVNGEMVPAMIEREETTRR